MYIPASGQRYERFLDGLHQNILFDWYMEIGCRTGRTFAPVRSKTIAVDPFFRAEGNIIASKPALHVFQATSDDFYASGFLKKNGIKLSFSFLDGMHLFEYLLRDFIGAEAHSLPDGVIALHDCCPYGNGMTSRDLNDRPRGAWTGDVWKLIPILQTWRPDLTITVLDCKPTGLVLISGLDPKSTVLKRKYDEILASFNDTDLDGFGPDRFFGSFAYTDARAFAAEGYPLFSGVRLSEDKALTPVLMST